MNLIVMHTMSYVLRNKKDTGRLTVSIVATRQRVAGLLLRSIVAVVLAISCLALQADPLLTYPLRVGEHSIRAELANTPQTRRNGLMFRQRLAESSGMIFVFPAAQRVSMWMKNTHIPLSVAFIDSDGRILNIEDMASRSEQTHWSNGSASYALEMNEGWFQTRGITIGDRVSGLERLPSVK